MSKAAGGAAIGLREVYARCRLDMQGRVAVVTGGARGIGRATATLLAAFGARVAVWDLVEDVAARASAMAAEAAGLVSGEAEADTTGGGADARPMREPLRLGAADSTVGGAEARATEVIGMRLDVTDEEAVGAAAEAVATRLGPVDVCVHAAAVGSGHYGFPFWNVPPSAWRRVLDVDVLGAVNVATVLAPAMAERRRGALVFVGSVAGLIGSQTDPPYSAAKAAIRNFAHCMAKDLAPLGVRVNVVCPGMVRTDLNRSVWEAWARRQPEGSAVDYDTWAEQKIRTVVPQGRWQSAADVAAAIAFLCSDAAASITGQTLNVDGGYVMT
ncbi:MAG: SDR family oxidoreductase [Planctomycetota bacterium]|nr:MAG: SDR family oxidoreductase [Planctomycetota bacterium]